METLWDQAVQVVASLGHIAQFALLGAAVIERLVARKTRRRNVRWSYR